MQNHAALNKATDFTESRIFQKGFKCSCLYFQCTCEVLNCMCSTLFSHCISWQKQLPQSL